MTNTFLKIPFSRILFKEEMGLARSWVVKNAYQKK